MLSLTFNGSDSRVIAWLQSSASELVAVLRLQLLQEMIETRDVVVEDKLSGDVLDVQSGTLRRAQHADVAVSGTTITGAVSTDPSASKYGIVQEMGGTFNVREHLRRSSLGHEAWIREHSITFPERSFLRSTLAEMAPQIVEGLQNAVDDYIKHKNLG